jgi:hypothetical protein
MEHPNKEKKLTFLVDWNSGEVIDDISDNIRKATRRHDRLHTFAYGIEQVNCLIAGPVFILTLGRRNNGYTLDS